MRRLWADRFREAGLDPVITLLALLIIAALLALMASGCDLGITSTNVNNNRNDVNAPPCQPTPCPTGATGGGGLVPLTCIRTYCTAVGHCSGILCTWQDGKPYDLCARHHSGGLPDQCYAGSVSGTSIDPGPPAGGAGTWYVTIESAGVSVGGPVAVVTDS